MGVQEIDDTEAERRRRERELLLLMMLLSDTSERHAKAAVRLGHDPVQAVADVWLGNPAIEQGGAAPAIAEALADAHEAGQIRTAQLIGSDGAFQPENLPEAYWRQRAARHVDDLYGGLKRTLIDRLAGVRTVKDRITAIDDAFAGGYDKRHPGKLDAEGSRAVLTAYNGGMLTGAKALKAMVTGLRHVSIVDSSTTPICRQRHNLQLPIDHPYWARGCPPLHFGCRSLLIAIIGKFTPSASVPSVPVDPGFGYPPASPLGAWITDLMTA